MSPGNRLQRYLIITIVSSCQFDLIFVQKRSAAASAGGSRAKKSKDNDDAPAGGGGGTGGADLSKKVRPDYIPEYFN
jgi:uncharacterized spore protein YtfJ